MPLQRHALELELQRRIDLEGRWRAGERSRSTICARLRQAEQKTVQDRHGRRAFRWVEALLYGIIRFSREHPAMTKYVFVTGGVVSSLGKGIAAASSARCSRRAGLKSPAQARSYINVDPGTMSPFQHGEVFVTDDGAETDLDLGHYERFTHARMTQAQQLHHRPDLRTVIHKERRGDYLGKTVQVIPHITDEIKATSRAGREATGRRHRRNRRHGRRYRMLPFLEAIRQMSYARGRKRTCFVHLTLVPYIATAGELKTKPTQHTVQKLREIGIQPDVLLCRADRATSGRGASEDLAVLERAGRRRDFRVGRGQSSTRFRICCTTRVLTRSSAKNSSSRPKPATCRMWAKSVHKLENLQSEVTIGMVGKYVELTESYKSLIEALQHASIHTSTKVNIEYIDSEQIEADGVDG